MILLLWTALDMSAPGLCALEREGDTSAAALVDATASLAAASIATGTAPLPDGSSSPVPHVDDCFCCSHCVDLSRHAVSIAPSGIVGRAAVPEPRLTDQIPPPPYHPPLLG